MAIKINFDVVHNPETPTLLLAKRNGEILGKLDAKSVETTDLLNNAPEIMFNVYKYIDDELCHLWDQIVDFKLVYCVEWDTWFEATVELDESKEIVKTVSCKQLGQAELSQIKLYNIQINTEDDILREDYELPTIFYYPAHPESSLLHRLMEKAPHYKILHVDDTIAKIQRTFTFDDISVYDAFQEIAEEIKCIFVFHSNTDEDGNIVRAFSVYDLESNCFECNYRGEFTNVCPNCGSTEIDEGYGNDTNIFITSDKLADSIQLTTDNGSIKNCFKLEAGDDLMTATIRNCNPNGTDYIWYISDAVKSDMTPELVQKIETYDDMYRMYQKDYIANLNDEIIQKYNALVKKYQKYNEDLEEIVLPVQGYSNIMNAYYNTIDLEVYLQSALMPSIEIEKTNAIKEAEKLTAENISPVSVTNTSIASLATVDNVVLSMAKIFVSGSYKVKIASSSMEKKSNNYIIWTGNFSLENYHDEEDVATSEIVSIVVDDNYASFVQQKIEKMLDREDKEDMSIVGLFEKSYNDFVLELKKYSLNYLTSFHSACQGCIDILIEQGIADKFTWLEQEPNLYDEMYIPYFNKLSAIEAEMKVRQDELYTITGIYDQDGELKTYGLQNYIDNEKLAIQKSLDFQSFIGEDLWLEFCSYRREDKYSNDNYISDGLNNAELFQMANEFVQVAQNEIYKSAELQHSITSTLKNLLVLKEFEPLVKDFQVGNWLRVMVDDKLYKLRLIEYRIDYDNLSTISVTFSDTVKVNSPIVSVQEAISQASSMATTYSSVKRQAKQGEKSNSVISGWANNGLDTTATKIVGGADNQTQTWDEHGMLFKKYDSISDSYDNEQLKIINSTIAITDDNWETVKTAIGAYYYFHPETGELIRAYGVNAEVMVGQLIIGEHLGIYNDNGSLSFSNDGLVVTNGVNTFRVNPNSDVLLAISNEEKDVFFIDNDGRLHISGDGSGIDFSENSDITDIKSKLKQNTEDIEKEVERAKEVETELKERIDLVETVFGFETDEESNITTFKFIADGLLNIDSSNKLNIGTSKDYNSNITIGKDGRNIYLVGNVYINGVLYTAN